MYIAIYVCIYLQMYSRFVLVYTIHDARTHTYTSTEVLYSGNVLNVQLYFCIPYYK